MQCHTVQIKYSSTHSAQNQAQGNVACKVQFDLSSVSPMDRTMCMFSDLEVLQAMIEQLMQEWKVSDFAVAESIFKSRQRQLKQKGGAQWRQRMQVCFCHKCMSQIAYLHDMTYNRLHIACDPATDSPAWHYGCMLELRMSESIPWREASTQSSKQCIATLLSQQGVRQHNCLVSKTCDRLL